MNWNDVFSLGAGPTTKLVCFVVKHFLHNNLHCKISNMFFYVVSRKTFSFLLGQSSLHVVFNNVKENLNEEYLKMNQCLMQ